MFNFAGMGKSGDSAKVLRTKELRNGRLAMIACLGFAGQAVVTNKGPIANLVDHVSAPFDNNLLANIGHMYGN